MDNWQFPSNKFVISTGAQRSGEIRGFFSVLTPSLLMTAKLMSRSVCFEPISESALYQGTTSVVPKRASRTRALQAAEKRKFLEGDGLQAVHNCFLMNTALAAEGAAFAPYSTFFRNLFSPCGAISLSVRLRQRSAAQPARRTLPLQHSIARPLQTNQVAAQVVTWRVTADQPATGSSPTRSICLSLCEVVFAFWLRVNCRGERPMTLLKAVLKALSDS